MPLANINNNIKIKGCVRSFIFLEDFSSIYGRIVFKGGKTNFLRLLTIKMLIFRYICRVEPCCEWFRREYK